MSHLVEKINLLIFFTIISSTFNLLILAEAQTRSTTTTEKPEEKIPTSCASFYRTTRRSGGSIFGEFDIPIDEQYPKFQLQVKFNRPIRSLTFRQTKARDINAHREYSYHMPEPESGILTINSIIRTSRAFAGFNFATFSRGSSRSIKINRIVLNGKTLCAVIGEATNGGNIDFDNDSIRIDSALKKTKNKFSNIKFGSMKINGNKKSSSNNNNSFEDDEDELLNEATENTQ